MKLAMKSKLLIPIVLIFLFLSKAQADNVTLNISSDSAQCFNSQDGSITVDILTGTGNYNYYLSKKNYYFFPGYVHIASATNQGLPTYTFNNLDTGKYYILVTDVHNDIGQGTVTIYEPLQLSGGVISVTKALTCNEGNDAILRANPTGGIAPYSYIWFYDDPPAPTNYVNTGVTTRDYTTAQQGKYYCRINDSHGCGPQSSVTLTFAYLAHDSVPAVLSVNATANPTCQGQNNGSVSISGAGGWTPFNYYIINSTNDTTGPQGGNSFTNLSADTYEPWITDNKGCTKKASNVTVTVSPLPTVDAGSPISICVANPLTAISMTGATASGSFSAANWTGGAGLGAWSQNANPALATFTPTTTSGSFTATLTLTGTNGCLGTNPTDTRTITWGQTPTVDAGSDINRCNGTPLAAITMTGATATGTFTADIWTGGGGLGTWSQNANPALATFTPTTTSGSFTATLTLTGGGACAGTNPSDTRTITWGQTPSVDAGANITRCDAAPLAAITMTGATATGTYSANNWTGGAGLGSWSQNANPALATFTPTTTSGSFTATLTLTGGGACAGTNPSDTRTITWGQTPVVDAGANINRCDATPLAAILMSGATASGSFSAANWTGGAGLGAWSQNANPALATFTPSTASGSFTATLTLTGSNGCLGTNPTDTRTITWGQTPTVDAGSDINRCNGTPLAAITMTGATATGTFTADIWTGGGGLGTWSQNANPALATFTPTTTSGSFTATLTLTGGGACAGTNPSDTRTITWGQTPSVDAGANITRCDAAPLAAITMTGATATGTYSANNWTGGAGLGSWSQNANPALATFTPTTTSGSFTATLTLTGGGACAGTNPSDTRTITWGQTPVVDAGANINRCDATPLAAILMSGATASGSFSAANWTGGAGLGAWSQNANPALATFTPSTASGSFTATLTLTGSNGCLGTNPTDTRTITWGQTPTVDAGSDINRCNGTPLAAITMTGATATGTFTADIWTGGGGLGTWSQNANPALATFTPTTTSGSFTATLTLTGGGACAGTNPSDTRTITWGQTPSVDAGANITRCDAAPLAAITMTGATATGTYSANNWTGGAGLGSWSQNANPALATFTPTTTSGSFTATLTLTGGGACAGTNPSDTRTITWGQTPVVDAGANINRCDATPLAAILMSGATASGSFSAANWTGGAGLGAWSQNANPALATFTPSTASGSFTATLTLTGSNGCLGTNPTDTRTITWGQTPTVDAGSDINRCNGTPLAAITMTGATATGTFTADIWTGGGGLGTWSQNANPALATFTPTTTSGSFTATLTLTGGGACAGTNPSDTRTITWGQTPSVDAGANITRCDAAPLAAITMTGATATGTYSANNWTGGAGLGSWSQNANPALATFTPTTTSGSFTATLTLTGGGACAGTNPSDTRTITWGQTPVVDAGANINRCDATPLAAILMSGATASGSFSAANWTGGAGLGAWSQNANPALATFTPTTTSGSFTATLTLTGTNGCLGTNPTDTRTITWGQTPTVDAGSDINRCNGTPLAAITMTGATATGTFTADIWTGGGGLGTWSQNANPALATFTPTTTSGSFTATLTLTGGGACAGTNPSDTRTITWGQTPSVDAGANITRCDAAPLAAITMTGATATGTYSANNWTGGTGLGSWSQNANPALATFTPTTTSGSFTATLTLTGGGACAGTNPSDTRTITWGQTPVVDAGANINRCDATPLAAILMSGATASGSFSAANWTGGAGLGAWSQNANPALATFTPSTASGSFTATLTLTGTGACSGANPTDTRTITWGESPTIDAGSDIDRCDGNPRAPITMTGSSSAGTYTSVTWSGGLGLGNWSQNANPALARFTPTTNSGSFVATLTITGSGACSGTNPTDTRTITWNKAPVVNAGNDTTLCRGSEITLNATLSDYNTFYWDKGSSDGSFDNEFIDNPIYYPGSNDMLTGSIKLYLTATGNGSCSDVTDSITITLPPQLIATIGAPSPFVIGPNTLINVSVKVQNKEAIEDLSYYLQAPDGTRIPLKIANNFFLCNWADEADLTFTNDPSVPDTLDICSLPPIPGIPLSGTFRTNGDFTPIFGKDPANGAWSVLLLDCDYNIINPTDGILTYASINFTDTSYLGILETVAYESGAINKAINQSPSGDCGTTSYIAPIGLTTKCFESCDALGLVSVVGGTKPYVDYNWSPSPDAGNGTDSVYLCKGSYSLTITDALGCTSIATVEVSSPPKIEFQSFEFTDSLICGGINGGSIACRAIGGTGKLTYTLQPGNIPSSAADSGRFVNLSGGTFTLRVEDLHGCYKDTTISIYEPVGIQLDSVSIDSITCNTVTDGIIRVYASGGTQPYAYWITPGVEVNNDGVFENLGEGDYTIRITDANHCDTLSTSLISLVSPSELILSLVTSKNAVCHDSTGSFRLFVSGGVGPYESSVDNGSTFVPGLEISNLIPGIYNLAVRDKNGCIDNYATPQQIINPPVINIDSFSVEEITGCFGDTTGTLYVRANGGWGQFVYSLDGGSYLTNNLFDNLSGGSHILNIADSLGCVLTIDTVSIEQPLPIAVQKIVTPLPGGQQADLILITTGGTKPYQYSIDNGTAFQDTNLFTNLDPGVYHFVVEDSHGCTYSDTVRIIAKLLIVDILDYKDVSCFGFSDGGFTVLIQNGTQPYNVTITNAGTGDILREVTGYDQDIFADENFEAGSFDIRIVDSEAQIFDSVFIINQPPPIVPTIVSEAASCQEYINDGSIQVTSTGGAGHYTYAWSDNPAVTDSIRNDLASGSYFVTVTDANNCPVATEVIIMYDQAAVFAFAGGDATICAFTPYELQGLATAPDSILWTFDPNDLVINDENIYISDPGSLITTMSTNRKVNLILETFKNGCFGLDTATIDVFPISELKLYELTDNLSTEMDSLIYLSDGESYQFMALMTDDVSKYPAAGYVWSPVQGLEIDSAGLGTVSLTADSVHYTVSGTSVYGCVTNVRFTAILLRDLKIYSGFTPNGDGFNDKWIIENSEGYGQRIKVRIFNRWGELIFHSSGYDGSNAWDGTFKGKELPIGTYYYIIDVEGSNVKPLTGAVTLIR